MSTNDKLSLFWGDSGHTNINRWHTLILSYAIFPTAMILPRPCTKYNIFLCVSCCHPRATSPRHPAFVRGSCATVRDRRAGVCKMCTRIVMSDVYSRRSDEGRPSRSNSHKARGSAQQIMNYLTRRYFVKCHTQFTTKNKQHSSVRAHVSNGYWSN